MECKSPLAFACCSFSICFILTIWNVNDLSVYFRNRSDSGFILTIWNVNGYYLRLFLRVFESFILTIWNVNLRLYHFPCHFL